MPDTSAVAEVLQASKFQQSLSLFARGQGILPGGVSSPVRAFHEVESDPVFVERGEGAYLYDVDGNSYVDFINGLGPMILGHGHPAVVEALTQQCKRGLVYALPTEQEYELAAMTIEATPAIDRLRFVCSGTEAVMTVLRLAKAATGRRKVLKFKGGYHGHSDALLARASKPQMRAAAGATSVNNGLDPAVVESVPHCEYNDAETMRQIFEDHRREIAAVVVEPIATNMGIVPPLPEFLGEARRLCDDSGALLIFDEVVSGFRFCFGSVSKILGVTPDLVTYGKIIGGGLPVGAYGGRAEVMDILTKSGGVFQGGTFAGSPVTMAAGLAQLRQLREPGFYEEMGRKGALVRDGLRRGFEGLGLPFAVQGMGSLFSIILIDGLDAMRNSQDVARQNAALFSALHKGLVDRGYLLPPSIEEPGFISAAHTDDQLHTLVDHCLELLDRQRAS